jgi:hypothetical protein
MNYEGLLDEGYETVVYLRGDSDSDSDSNSDVSSDSGNCTDSGDGPHNFNGGETNCVSSVCKVALLCTHIYMNSDKDQCCIAPMCVFMYL